MTWLAWQPHNELPNGAWMRAHACYNRRASSCLLPHPPPQALQCCLGVKASDTGRANTFKKVRI